jgi:hypothetical protein
VEEVVRIETMMDQTTREMKRRVSQTSSVGDMLMTIDHPQFIRKLVAA